MNTVKTTAELRQKHTVEVLLSLGILRDRLPKLGYDRELLKAIEKIDVFVRLNTDDGAALSIAGAVLKENL